MKVSQLIECLQKMPPDAEVRHLWDGELRTAIEHVWLTREGQVGTGDFDEVCYSDDSWPVDASTGAQYGHWYTPSAPKPRSETMSEPVRKHWSEDELRETAMEFMRVDFRLPDRDDEEARSRWYERLGLLVSFSAWMWDTHTPGDATVDREGEPT